MEYIEGIRSEHRDIKKSCNGLNKRLAILQETQEKLKFRLVQDDTRRQEIVKSLSEFKEQMRQ